MSHRKSTFDETFSSSSSFDEVRVDSYTGCDTYCTRCWSTSFGSWVVHQWCYCSTTLVVSVLTVETSKQQVHSTSFWTGTCCTCCSFTSTQSPIRSRWCTNNWRPVRPHRVRQSSTAYSNSGCYSRYGFQTSNSHIQSCCSSIRPDVATSSNHTLPESTV